MFTNSYFQISLLTMLNLTCNSRVKLEVNLLNFHTLAYKDNLRNIYLLFEKCSFSDNAFCKVFLY